MTSSSQGPIVTAPPAVAEGTVTSKKPSRSLQPGVSLSKVAASELMQCLSSDSVENFNEIHKVMGMLETTKVEEKLKEEEQILRDIERELDMLQPDWATLKKPLFKGPQRDISTEPELAHISRRSLEVPAEHMGGPLVALRNKHREQAHVVHELRDKVSLLEFVRTQDERLLRDKLGDKVTLEYSGPSSRGPDAWNEKLETMKEEQAKIVRCCQSLKLAQAELKEAHTALAEVANAPFLKSLIPTPGFLRKARRKSLAEYEGDESVGRSAAKHLERVQENMPELLKDIAVQELIQSLNKYDDALRSANDAKKVADKIDRSLEQIAQAAVVAATQLEAVNEGIKALERQKDDAEHVLHEQREQLMQQLIKDKLEAQDACENESGSNSEELKGGQ